MFMLENKEKVYQSGKCYWIDKETEEIVFWCKEDNTTWFKAKHLIKEILNQFTKVVI